MNQDSTVPLIDFSQFLHGSADERERVASNIDEAFRSVGFLYLCNHGIDEGKINEYSYPQSSKFFALSDSEKKSIQRPADRSLNRGYVGVGREKVRQRICIKEGFDTGNPHDDEEQPNQWPSEETLPGFRDFMELFFHECSKLVQQLLDALSVALNLHPATSLVHYHSASHFNMSLLHYPALPTRDLLTGAHTRIPAHSDFGTLTLLFQDAVGGLEIADPGSASTATSIGFEKDGRFRSVTPKPGTVVVNVGYLLMRWSNGRWKNTVHRVVEPPLSDEEGGKEVTPARYSVPFFASPDPATIVEALPGCWSEEVPKKWKAISAGDYIKRKRRAAYA
ncbi:thymine dioxygenase [Usnea florida]